MPYTLPKGTPITIQVSPNTYKLMLRMIELGVDFPVAPDPSDTFTVKPNVQIKLDELYLALGGGVLATATELRNLQDAGIAEANDINKAAKFEVVLTC